MLPMGASASPGSALREYNDGKYDEALKDYNQALEKHKDDPRLHFNAGAAAYQSRHLDEAAKEFNEALAATQDLQLQQRAYYNLANTMYRAGQQASDPQKKQEAWENAIKGYESALKLNPQDPDAKFNQDFVTKQLEELKKQQQSQSDSKNIEPSDAAKRAKAIADEQMQRRNYRQALETMESQLQRDPTTSYYQDYMKRLKEVVDVQENTGH
jgi:Ca-activated chloride channel family protein